jgi:cytochrome c peroxidase
MKLYNSSFLLLCFIILITACKKDTEPISPSPSPFTLKHEGLPTPSIAADNPFTKEGIELGRRLFYEKLLSKDATMSCASCHAQANAFADTTQFSIGVEGLPGKRQAMAVFNMAWNENEFFWDGRAHLLRDQALLPIQDPLEMNETLENVIAKLHQQDDYVQRFKKAFDNGQISELNISLALEQFMNTIVSNKSKYDKFLANEVQLSPSEERGRQLFFAPFDPNNQASSGANCANCHGGPNFENDSYMNNGLDAEENITDLGRKEVLNTPFTKGTFKVPSLRNIELTFPYMHDGRFKTLEEVIDHYDHGVEFSSTLNATLASIQNNNGLMLRPQDKVDLIAFLKTLTDYELINNADYSDPF